MAQGINAITPPRLIMRGVCKRFGATVALDNVEFAVHPGEVHALVGENGAGKSTLMKVLSGAILPDAGEMQIEGCAYHPANPLDARRAGVAMIYQELSLAPHLSVEENITLGMEPTRLGLVDWREVRRKAVEAISHFEHPEIRPDVLVRRLPAGARQLIEIARALAIGCRVLVLDEPTSSLSHNDVERLFGLIHRLKQQDHAIVYISHFIEEVKLVADRVTVLRDGKVAGAGKTSQLGTAAIITMMVGRQVDDLYSRTPRTPGDVLLETKALAGIEKPSSASLTLHRGEVLGIAGLVGAGRTEFLRAIFGLDPVRRGQIKLGVYLGPASPVARLAQGAGLLSESRNEEGLAASLNVSDNMTLSKLNGLGPLGLVLPGKQNDAARRWIKRLDIHCRGPWQRVASLSGGNQQKVALARLLHHNVDLLLLDEPTRGIDVGSKAQVYKLIDKLATGNSESGRPPKAVLMVSGYLPELLGVCDRIAVMCRGKLGPARPVAEIDERTLMMEATGGKEAAA